MSGNNNGYPSSKAEFELPCGYEDEAGTVHKTVIMRKMRSKDILEIQKDMKVKEFANKPVKMDRDNPIGAILGSANLSYLFALLFTRVVEAVGNIPRDKINKDLFLDLYQEDMFFLMNQYAELNNMNPDELINAGGNAEAPLTQ